MFRIVFTTVAGEETHSLGGFESAEAAEAYLDACVYTGIAHIEEE